MGEIKEQGRKYEEKKSVFDILKSLDDEKRKAYTRIINHALGEFETRRPIDVNMAIKFQTKFKNFSAYKQRALYFLEDVVHYSGPEKRDSIYVPIMIEFVKQVFNEEIQERDLDDGLDTTQKVMPKK